MNLHRFKALPHTVVLNYQSSLLLTQDEVAIVLLGPFSNVCLFCLLILISWVSQKAFGSFPGKGRHPIVGKINVIMTLTTDLPPPSP